MCGRFYVDDETARDIERIVRKIDKDLWNNGDVHPSEQAFALQVTDDGKEIEAKQQSWGYTMSGRTGLIFNARSETVLQKPFFRTDFEYRRANIPAKKFYEWKAVDRKNKEKYEFYDNRSSLYLAAIFHLSDRGKQFTIITRPAAGCMVGIHDRMPLILEKEDIEEWLFSKKSACKLLEKCFEQLHRRKSDTEGYQQLSLFG